MGYKSIRTSDIRGEVVEDDQVVTVVVRAEGKLFDAKPEELAPLKPLTNVVELELRKPDGSSEEVIVSRADFDKVVTLKSSQRQTASEAGATASLPKLPLRGRSLRRLVASD